MGGNFSGLSAKTRGLAEDDEKQAIVLGGEDYSTLFRDSNDVLEFEIKLRCTGLVNNDKFYKINPYLRISCIAESGELSTICETEVVFGDSNPVWQPLNLTFAILHHGSKEKKLIIECFDYKTDGDSVPLGQLEKSIADLEQNWSEKVGMNLVMPPSVSRRNKNVLEGKLFVDKFSEFPVRSFY